MRDGSMPRVLLLAYGPYFHLGAFQRIFITSKLIPHDSISIRCMMSAMIQAVEIRVVTCVIPPRSFVLFSAVGTTIVVVVIFG